MATLLLVGLLLIVSGKGVQADTTTGPADSQPTSVPVASQPGDDWPSSPQRPPIAARRIVKHFDFNERSLGNLENLPMYWQKQVAVGFPVYLEGGFDFHVGHATAPSFRMELNGGSIGYTYNGHDIAVRPNGDYLVIAWIRTQALHHARAYFTVCFLDRKGTPLPGTERMAPMVGGPEATDDWQPVSIAVRGDSPDARYLGISLWLAQERVWNTHAHPLRTIEQEDIEGVAWFDDISVYRMPRVALRSTGQGHVFDVDETPGIVAEVSDPDGLQLTAMLNVRSEDGTFQTERAVNVYTGEQNAGDRVEFADLPVGLYHVDLVVHTGSTELVRRSLRFVKLPARFSPPGFTGRKFGVVLDDIEPRLLAAQRELVRVLHVEYAKLPVWYAQQAAMGRLPDLLDSIDAYLKAIVDAGAEPIGIMTDDVSTSRSHQETNAIGIGTAPVEGGNTSIRSMIELLSEAPLTWKPMIAGVWSRYSGLIHVWQLGVETDLPMFLDHRFPSLVPVIRREMSTLMSEPLLATVASVNHEAFSTRLADYRTAVLPPDIAVDDIAGYLTNLVGNASDRLWVQVDPLEVGRYPRQQRLEDFSRRLVETYHQKVGAVFIRAPWQGRSDLLTAQADPVEDYIIFRTVADVLGDATPVSRTNIDGQAECFVFDRNQRAILFVWDSYAPPEGIEHVLYLGESAEQIDLWGRRQPIESVGRCQKVRIGPTPTFIVNTPTWLIELRRQFRIEPAILEASFDASEREIVFRNTHSESISGQLRLLAPRDWDIRPNRLPFSVRAGEEFRQKVAIRFPANANAGITPLVGEFAIDADHRYNFTTPAWFELGLDNIDMQTFVYRSDGRVVVRQTMTNRTDRVVNFEGFLVAPGRQRISRLFANFLPGQSLSKSYVLDNADDLANRKIRVGLKEMQGTRMWNRVITVP